MVKGSIIICTGQAPKALVRTLTSLTEQMDSKFHSTVEIILVVNRPEYFANYAETGWTQQFNGVAIKLLEEPLPGLMSARHAGLKATNAQVLAFSDDDVVFGPHWLSCFLELAESPQNLLATGPSKPPTEIRKRIPPEIQFEIADYGTVCGSLSLLDFGSELRTISPQWVWGLNFIISRDLIEAAAGFHPDAYPKDLIYLRGDGECGLTSKLQSVGVEAIYEPRLLVYHHFKADRYSPQVLAKRYFAEGITQSYQRIRKNRSNVPFFPHSVHQNLCDLQQQMDANRTYQKLEFFSGLGAQWHQALVAENPCLKDWCLKEDYRDIVTLPRIDTDTKQLPHGTFLRSRLILFGIGSGGEKGTELYRETHDILAYCDNNETMWSTFFMEKPVISPEKLHQIEFDAIVICSQFSDEIITQLSCLIPDRMHQVFLAGFLSP